MDPGEDQVGIILVVAPRRRARQKTYQSAFWYSVKPSITGFYLMKFPKACPLIK